MANEPWISIPSIGFRAGPLTLDDEQRRLADEKWKALQAMQSSPVATKYAGLRPGTKPDNLVNSMADGHAAYTAAASSAPGIPPHNVDPDQASMNEAMGYPADPGIPPSVSGNVSPGVPDIGSFLGRMFGNDPWKLVGGGHPAATPAAVATSDGPVVVPPSNAQATTNMPGTGYEGDPVATASTPTANETLASQMQQYKDLINQIYPKADMSETPKQKKADEFAANDFKRTALLAQLAMASGITAQAGYGEVAKGFGAAASVEMQGFKRYQDALQDGADRELSRRDVAYKDDLTRSQAAYKLYADQISMNKEEMEKRRKENIDFLKEGAFPKPDANGLLDPTATAEQTAKWRRAYEYLLKTGQMIEPDALDVRDTPS